MNCKPGDLAVVVSCLKGEEACLGHICTILEMDFHPITGEVGWHFEPPTQYHGHNCTFDKHLRSIRDNPGEDESLQWAPVPGEKVTA